MRNNAARWIGALLGGGTLLAAIGGFAADWPQWRGPNRDNKVMGFNAPASWPKELARQWKTTVGVGDASPALVGNRLYVFTRQADDEMILCLDATTGKILWGPETKYPSVSVGGGARDHPGPRGTPAVAEGTICTFGVAGVITCLDAATGAKAWKKETKGRWPHPGR